MGKLVSSLVVLGCCIATQANAFIEKGGISTSLTCENGLRITSRGAAPSGWSIGLQLLNVCSSDGVAHRSEVPMCLQVVESGVCRSRETHTHISSYGLVSVALQNGASATQCAEGQDGAGGEYRQLSAMREFLTEAEEGVEHFVRLESGPSGAPVVVCT